MTQSINIENKKMKSMNEKKRGDKIFFWALVAYPLLQLAVFYFYVNIDSFPLAFQSYDRELHVYSFADPLVNFRRYFNELTMNSDLVNGLLRNLLSYAFGLIVATPINMFIAYLIYKKVPGHKVFKIMFYAPSVVSSTVWVLLYTQMLEQLIPAVVNLIAGVDIGGLLSNYALAFPLLLLFGRWVPGLDLLYLSTMMGVPEEQVESMRLDGAGKWKEFWHLLFPYLWPLWSMLTWMGVSGILAGDMGLYTFYGESAPSHVKTYGYWVSVIKVRASSNVFDIPYLAAISMIESALVIPIMFAVKKIMSKVGPSAD